MVGIISNSAALFAQRNLATASSTSESSIARLSSGNAIVSAADDVAGLAIGTVLRTTVSTLKTILNSAAQATSLLGIADAGLQNIGEILQRQKSLAVQANTGSLSDNERAFLDQEFQNLVSEINRIVDNTKFNGIALLNGSISGAAGLTTATASASGNFSLNATGDYGGSFYTSGNGNSYVASTLESTTVGTAIQFATAQTGGVQAQTVITIGSKTNGTELITGNKASDTITFGAEAGDNTDVVIDGQTFTFLTASTGAPTAINRGGSAAQSAANLAAAINSAAGQTLLGNAYTATVAGTTVTITAAAVGTAGNTTLTTDVVGATFGSTTGVIDGGVDALTLEIDNDGAGGAAATVFTFVDEADATGSNLEIVIDQAGDTTAQIAAKVAAHLNDTSTNGGGALTGAQDYNFAVTGSTITATAKVSGVAANNDIIDFVRTTSNTAFGTVVEADEVGGTLGVASAAVSTPTYQTTLQGAITNVSATFIAGDANNNARIQLSASVGGVTYLSNIFDLGATPTIDADDAFTFTSQASTGATDVTFTLNVDNAYAGLSVTSQANATTFANALQADLDGSGFVITQSRLVSSFTEAKTDGTALQGLTAADVKIVADGFSTSGGFGSLEAFTVDRASDTISTIIDGVTYSAVLSGTGLDTTGGGSYASGVITTGGAAVIVLSSEDVTDGRQIRIDLQNVAAATITFDSDEGEAALENVLNTAFAIGGSASLNFQVGTTAADSIGLSLGSAATTSIYKDADDNVVTLSVATAEGAIDASDVLDRAINTVTSLRATVGALQSRFNFASSNVNASIQNTEAARAIFLDVDIAEESTKFATAQVRLQASISVLAQANLIPQNLLKLIG